jgi:hypothetical protein
LIFFSEANQQWFGIKMEFHKFRVGIDFIWKTTCFTSTRVRDRSEKPTATRSPSEGLRGLVADSPTPFLVKLRLD